MRSTYRTTSPLGTATPSRRASSFGLALAINLLILLVLLGFGASAPLPKLASDPLVVTLEPDAAPARASAPAAKAAPTPKPIKPPPVAPPPPVVKLPPLKKQPLDLLVISKDELAASDVAKLPAAGTSGGSSAGDSQEAGVGPNGQTLYAAEWARHPTSTELGAYLPHNMPAEGWGLVACRTIPDRRVTDCVELDSYPRSAHLARAVRDAAWQFRVRPPRKGGKEMVGEWVSIRITYTDR
ncbi:MAG: hypothetical protein ABIQ32_03895 [Sphingomicrobium sp.]